MSHHNIQPFFEALASRDADRIAAVLTEDSEWFSPPGNAVAVALEATNHMKGRAAIVQFFADELPRLFVRDVGVTFNGVHSAGEHVVVEAELTATLPDGNRYLNDYCFVVEFRNGLVHRVREYADTPRGLKCG
ncbi:nuclear transport factor 2 family protein [Amycolatopsis albispora]|uniref:Ketosteroid isomerase n=1 Tax=Amycolatopsis albispora TaxID=1804986 RepID=A0A344L0Q5_9PSEU|nr:nuclear transport factor 2 family protein [Amycolatopsis albispora]AXB41629.1 ketosteroid isomerase [Amycolatopsis albispora]